MASQNKANGTGLWVLIFSFLAALFCLVVNQVLIWTDAPVRTIETIWLIFQVFAFAAVALSFINIVLLVRRIQTNSNATVEHLRSLLAGQTQNEAVLTIIGENILLSDSIKSIAFRRKDRAVLEGAIQQDIRSEQWDSAQKLIEELETTFGCKKEAQKLRQELISSQNSTRQEKIDAAIKHIESLKMIHHYKEAAQQEEELLKLYPDNEKVQQIQGQTEQRRLAHKTTLLEQLDQSAKNNDFDHGVELLKLLDNYLTPTEAAALEESARGVFRARLHKMGVQFSLFVTEKSWGKALKLGKEIVKEYPNSRMAQEVREKMDALETRAR